MGITEEIFNPTTSHTRVTNAANPLNTPPVNTPSGAMTPSPAMEKRRGERSAIPDQTKSGRPRSRDTAVDPNALSKALMKEFEETGRPRNVTPSGSPSRKRQRIYGDR
jgi:cell division cycle 20-like protein 1, cofactor of APC complex